MTDCPTCRGKGVLPSPDSKDGHKMVTFTPMSDIRLKPRRTWIYIVAGIIVVGVASFLAGFFIYPRPMELTKDPDLPEILTPIWSELHLEDDNATFLIRNSWILRNPSYFPVTLTRLDVQISWSFQSGDMKPIMSTNFTQVTVAPRSSIRISQNCLINFSGDLGFMAWYCAYPNYYFYTTFQAVAKVNINWQNSSDIVQTFQKTSCYKENYVSMAKTAPRGSVPHGSVPPGSLPHGSVPHGSVPPEIVPPGSVPHKSVPPGSVPHGSVPHESGHTSALETVGV